MVSSVLGAVDLPIGIQQSWTWGDFKDGPRDLKGLEKFGFIQISVYETSFVIEAIKPPLEPLSEDPFCKI